MAASGMDTPVVAEPVCQKQMRSIGAKRSRETRCGTNNINGNFANSIGQLLSFGNVSYEISRHSLPSSLIFWGNEKRKSAKVISRALL